MYKRMIIANTLLVMAGLLILSAPTARAVECSADMNCDGAVGPPEIGYLLADWGKFGCSPSTKCNRCPWPCYESGSECLFNRTICEDVCLSNTDLINIWHLCPDICMWLDIDPSGDTYCGKFE